MGPMVSILSLDHQGQFGVLTMSKGHNYFWEASSCLASGKKYLLWNKKIHCHVHKSLPLVLILSRVNQIHISLEPILIPSSHLRLSLPSGHFLWEFMTKYVYTFLVSSMHATWPNHLISWSGHPNNTWLRGHIAELLTMQYPPVALCHFQPSVQNILLRNMLLQ
jgi:hypothetical protein